ncbi:c-type cytochrome [Donghicola mangrovi]
MATCVACHGREGQGQHQWIPPLAALPRSSD